MTRTLTGMMAALALLATAGTASAAAPGEVFGVAGLPLPPGGIAAAQSGDYDDERYRSEASADGRYVAFVSAADTLDPAAHPDTVNVFRKDRVTGEVALVSRAGGVAGAVPAASGWEPRISADGTRISWLTRAALDPADTAAAGAGASSAPSISGNGGWVAFASQSDDLVSMFAEGAPGTTDVFARDMAGATTYLISRRHDAATPTGGNGDSGE